MFNEIIALIFLGASAETKAWDLEDYSHANN